MDGDTITLFNPRHQVPNQIRFPQGLELNVLKAINGERTVAGVILEAGVAPDNAGLYAQVQGFIRQLYLADIIHLSRPAPATN